MNAAPATLRSLLHCAEHRRATEAAALAFCLSRSPARSLARFAPRQQQPEQAKFAYFDTRNNENGECYKKMIETKRVCFNEFYLAVQKLMCVPYPF